LNSVDASNLPIEQLDQVVIVLAYDFGENVEAAGCQHNVVDGSKLAERFGDDRGVTGDSDSDHCLTIETELKWVSDSNDLHHSRIRELLNALAHGRFAQSDRFADLGIGPSAIVLQLFNNRLLHLVELHGPGTDRARE